MVKNHSKDLTLRDIKRIDKYGAEYVSKKYNINYSLAKTCEIKLHQHKQIGGNDSYNGKRSLRKCYTNLIRWRIISSLSEHRSTSKILFNKN